MKNAKGKTIFLLQKKPIIFSSKWLPKILKKVNNTGKTR